MDVIFLKSLRPLYCDYISRILCVRRAQQRRPPRPPFMYFYSRPYARGDAMTAKMDLLAKLFLLAPLREGRPTSYGAFCYSDCYFYSRPYARGDLLTFFHILVPDLFLLAPLREGRPSVRMALSRSVRPFLLTPLREGRPSSASTK